MSSHSSQVGCKLPYLLLKVTSTIQTRSCERWSRRCGSGQVSSCWTRSCHRPAMMRSPSASSMPHFSSRTTSGASRSARSRCTRCTSSDTSTPTYLRSVTSCLSASSQWRSSVMVKALAMRFMRSRVRPPSYSTGRQLPWPSCSHTCASITKQYNLVQVIEQRWPVARKVTVSVTSCCHASQT